MSLHGKTVDDLLVENAQMEVELEALRKKMNEADRRESAPPNKHGPAYEKYYTMNLGVLQREYQELSALEFKLRQIVAERESFEKRKQGINCHCNGLVICDTCGADYSY